MNKRDKLFIKRLKEAVAIVKSWPGWKQAILGSSYQLVSPSRSRHNRAKVTKKKHLN